MRVKLILSGLLALLLLVLGLASLGCGGVSGGAETYSADSNVGGEGNSEPKTTSTLDVIHLPSPAPQLDFEAFTIDAQFSAADLVVIGTVVEQIPIRRNPSTYGGADEEKESLPVLYEGYVVKVERWFGDFQPMDTIRMFGLADGQFEENGRLYEITYDMAADLQPGDIIIIPLEKEENYGVSLGPNDYWMLSSGASAFVLDRKGSDPSITATRASGITRMLPASVGVSERETLGSLISATLEANLAERSVE